jgi:hypothetical protein
MIMRFSSHAVHRRATSVHVVDAYAEPYRNALSVIRYRGCGSIEIDTRRSLPTKSGGRLVAIGRDRVSPGRELLI